MNDGKNDNDKNDVLKPVEQAEEGKDAGAQRICGWKVACGQQTLELR